MNANLENKTPGLKKPRNHLFKPFGLDKKLALE